MLGVSALQGFHKRRCDCLGECRLHRTAADSILLSSERLMLTPARRLARQKAGGGGLAGSWP